VSKLLPIIERELAPFDACPHWGKLFTTAPSELKRVNKKTPQFIGLCKKFDPQGKFRNQFLNQNIFD
jgi:alditol oxidase